MTTTSIYTNAIDLAKAINHCKELERKVYEKFGDGVGYYWNLEIVDGIAGEKVVKLTRDDESDLEED